MARLSSGAARKLIGTSLAADEIAVTAKHRFGPRDSNPLRLVFSSGYRCDRASEVPTAALAFGFGHLCSVDRDRHSIPMSWAIGKDKS
jgi:hypothetical protein